MCTLTTANSKGFLFKVQKDSIIIYRSFYEAIKDLPKELQADAWQCIFEYGLNDATIDANGIVSTVFKLIKPQLDANKKRFENGQKGGRPKVEQKTETKPNNNQTETKTKPNVNDNVNVNVNHNHNVNNNEKEITNVISDPSIDEIFEIFWIAYQKNGNKKTSLTAFKKLTKTEMKLVKEHLPIYLNNHYVNNKMDFLPHFSTYLNQKRWNDKLPYADKREQMNNWGI